MNWLNLPKKVYFKPGSKSVALKELKEVYGFKSAFIISDANLYTSGVVAPVDEFVKNLGIRTAEFFTVDAVPAFENARSGLPKMLEFEPDVIIGVGGGSVMSIAKVMWLLYENPDIDLNEVADKFTSTTLGDAAFPVTGAKAKLVLVATTAGTGAECSPFAVVADDAGKKRVIASYRLLPEMAVIDTQFSENLPAEITKSSALTALSQAARAYTCETTTDYVRGFARDAVKRVLENVEEAVAKGAEATDARYNLSNAAAIAGMAFSNAVDTFDPEAGFYPTDAEKAANPEKTAELAAYAGLESAEELFKAIEKIAAL